MTKYVVIQFVPDPVADERINVGVAAYDEDQVRVRFVSSWTRAKHLGGAAVEGLREFASEFCKAADDPTLLEMADEGRWQVVPSSFESLIRWRNAIQFSEPRVSVRTIDDLLEEVATLYLKQPTPARRHHRDRRQATALARSAIRNALQHQLEPDRAAHLFRQKYDIHGAFAEHAFDVAVANGVPQLLGHGLSFEGRGGKDRQRELDATAWMVDDLRRGGVDIPIGIVCLPPATTSKLFSTAERVFEGLGAAVVPEDEAATWAEQTVRGLALV